MVSMMASEKFDGTISTAEEAKKMCVLGNRVLAMDKLLDAFGHVTVRNPERPDTFFISWATSPEFVTTDDLQLCDFEGNILGGDKRRAYGERILHSRIFKARPDVNAIVHGHPASLFPFACSDLQFKPVTGGSGLFYDGVPLLKEWDPESGIHIATVKAGDDLARALGGKRAALIRNHGMVAVGNCVQQLAVVAGSLAGTASVLLMMLQIGVTPYCLSEEEAKKAEEASLTAIGIERSWNYKMVKVREAFPDLRGF